MPNPLAARHQGKAVARWRGFNLYCGGPQVFGEGSNSAHGASRGGVLTVRLYSKLVGGLSDNPLNETNSSPEAERSILRKSRNGNRFG